MTSKRQACWGRAYRPQLPCPPSAGPSSRHGLGTSRAGPVTFWAGAPGSPQQKQLGLRRGGSGQRGAALSEASLLLLGGWGQRAGRGPGRAASSPGAVWQPGSGAPSPPPRPGSRSPAWPPSPPGGGSSRHCPRSGGGRAHHPGAPRSLHPARVPPTGPFPRSALTPGAIAEARRPGARAAPRPLTLSPAPWRVKLYRAGLLCRCSARSSASSQPRSTWRTRPAQARPGPPPASCRPLSPGGPLSVGPSADTARGQEPRLGAPRWSPPAWMRRSG